MIIVDGKKISSEILDALKLRVDALKSKGEHPALAVILVGEDKASHTYVARKNDASEKIGVEFFKFEFPETVSEDELIRKINLIQQEHNLDGLIVQFPLPENLWEKRREITNHINIDIDVDCLSNEALGKVLVGESKFVPPTPGAIMEILKYHGVDLVGKNVCIVGRGDLIGKPLTGLLLNKPVSVTVCGRDTKNLSNFTKSADIIVTGIGKAGIVSGDMLKDGVVVVDAGVSFVDGKMLGDVDFNSAKEKASIITPVPGGVGPITVAKLLENVVLSCEMKTGL